jgi:hypothetical protein
LSRIHLYRGYVQGNDLKMLATTKIRYVKLELINKTILLFMGVYIFRYVNCKKNILHLYDRHTSISEHFMISYIFPQRRESCCPASLYSDGFASHPLFF